MKNERRKSLPNNSLPPRGGARGGSLDAHQHFWRYHPQRHAWIDASMSILQRDFLPADLEPIYQKYDIKGCIAVQAEQSTGETDFLLALAAAHPFIKGVVGWIDLCAPDIEERLQQYMDRPKLVGFRHIVQDEPDPDFMRRADFMRGLHQLARHGFTYDILIYPNQMPAALAAIEQAPELSMVVDHLAKPYIKQGQAPGWEDQIRAVAEHPQVYCKLSGMVTEADWTSWRYEDMLPWLEIVFDAFGPERLMFGSDWPVCLLAADYGQVKGIVHRFIEPLSPAAQAGIWGLNAAAFYGISA